jgi:hypothetical protein
MAAVCGVCWLESPEPKDAGLHHAQGIKMPTERTQHNPEQKWVLGLRVATNQRRNLVQAVKVFSERLLADAKNCEQLQRPAKPHREFGGGFGCLRSCGQ